MRTQGEQLEREDHVTGRKTYAQVTEDISRTLESFPTKTWLTAFAIAASILGLGLGAWGVTLWFGLGMWGIHNTNARGADIINFVFWIGIGHAGTLISAILLLFRQRWRTGVNRAAEAMTIFAVVCAGQFPIFHMGRVWLAFFIFPFPNTRGPLWTNFNSPLLWDLS